MDPDGQPASRRSGGWRDIWGILRETYEEWNRDNAPQFGAALAFYTTFSMAPLLIIIIGIGGIILSKGQVQAYILAEVHKVLGPESTAALKGMIERGYRPGAGFAATGVGLALLLVGAARVFEALRTALNALWGVQPDSKAGVMNIIRVRLMAFGLILAIGLLIMLSLLVSTGLTAFLHFMDDHLPLPRNVYRVMDFGITLAMVTLLFGLIYKYLSDARIAWRDVAVGALLTALLFTVGKVLLGLYLGRSSIGSAYGAAGSLVVILFWVYYSAQIFFLGAEFTKVYARRQGRPLGPGKYARPLE